MAYLEELVHLKLGVIEVMDQSVSSRQEVIKHLLDSLTHDFLELDVSSSELIHQTPMIKCEAMDKKAEVWLINSKEVFIIGIWIFILMQVIVSFVLDIVVLKQF